VLDYCSNADLVVSWSCDPVVLWSIVLLFSGPLV